MYKELLAETHLGDDLDGDGDRVDQILDDPLSLLKTSLMQPLRAGHHNTVRQHDGGQLLDIVRQAIGPSTDE